MPNACYNTIILIAYFRKHFHFHDGQFDENFLLFQFVSCSRQRRSTICSCDHRQTILRRHLTFYQRFTMQTYCTFYSNICYDKQAGAILVNDQFGMQHEQSCKSYDGFTVENILKLQIHFEIKCTLYIAQTLWSTISSTLKAPLLGM